MNNNLIANKKLNESKNKKEDYIIDFKNKNFTKY